MWSVVFVDKFKWVISEILLYCWIVPSSPNEAFDVKDSVCRIWSQLVFGSVSNQPFSIWRKSDVWWRYSVALLIGKYLDSSILENTNAVTKLMYLSYERVTLYAYIQLSLNVLISSFSKTFTESYRRSAKRSRKAKIVGCKIDNFQTSFSIDKLGRRFHRWDTDRRKDQHAGRQKDRQTDNAAYHEYVVPRSIPITVPVSSCPCCADATTNRPKTAINNISCLPMAWWYWNKINW